MFPHVFMCLKSHKRENSGTNCSHTRKESHIYLIIVKQNNLQLYLGCYLTGKIWGFPLLQRCVEICKVMLKKFTSRVRKKMSSHMGLSSICQSVYQTNTYQLNTFVLYLLFPFFSNVQSPNSKPTIFHNSLPCMTHHKSTNIFHQYSETIPHLMVALSWDQFTVAQSGWSE